MQQFCYNNCQLSAVTESNILTLKTRFYSRDVKPPLSATVNIYTLHDSGVVMNRVE